MKKFVALLLAATMLFVAACGGNTDTPTTDTSSTPSTTTDTSTATTDTSTDSTDDPGPAAEPKILRFGTTGIDGKFLSVMSNNLYDSYVASLVFEGLVQNDFYGAPEPGPIAAGWVVSDDYLTYTFTLKDGITFSDGTPLTTADVEFTYKTLGHPDYDGPRSYAVQNLLGYEEYRSGATNDFAGVEVIDAKTIAFHYPDGLASPANIWDLGYGVMPKHIYEFTNWDDFLDQVSNPIGSGMFIFEEYRPMEIVRFSTNYNYWDSANTPSIDGVFMLDIPEESLQAAFLAGEVDIAQPETNIDNDAAYGTMAGVDLLRVLGNSYQYMAFNTTRPTLSDPLVRQALIYGLDRQAYIDINFGPLGTVGLAPISPASWAFPDSGMNDYALDLDKAAALFAEAGWEKGADGILAKDGVRMELTWLVYTETAWPGILSGLAYDTWGQLGVDLTIELMDFASVISQTMDAEPGEKDFDLYTMGFSLSIDPDPSGALFDYDAYSAGGFNASGYYNERAQELIYAGKVEFDQAKRTAIYHEWAQMMNELLPSVIVSYRYELWAISDRVNGMNIGTYWDWTRDLDKITLN